MKKVICGFLPIIWGLMFCTFLSQWIEEQMIAQSVILEAKMNETLELPLSAIVIDEAGTHLYGAEKEDGWSTGVYVNEIDPYLYEILEDKVLIRGALGKYIVYTSKPIVPGQRIRAVYQSSGKAAEYLVKGTDKFPERTSEEEKGWREFHVSEQGDNALMISGVGKEPFMEEQMKVELGFSEAVRIWKLEEIKSFGKALPQLAALLAIMIFTTCLWISGCRRIRTWPVKKAWIISSGTAAVGLLLLFRNITHNIWLPSSILPKQNIFDIQFYKEELTEVLALLGQFQNETAILIVREFQKNSVTALLILGAALVAGGALLVVEKRGRRKYMEVP